ncbi:hypothetical protein [Glaciimonas immobilis]|uniref:Right handed beta helix domain-containing protein n=1 Tax=Glaciimonas immobilis TaxID=728004 RepID=A0A840RVB8_9BURK|nr:hypothetical protein [Glaciimonas immobilis]KAF3999939.1 hypothetical protein HAV38_01825 [Glaciimonas immobilis]MBB5200440.1 hypothetical protein [Glaciimonas immobilis]
MSSAICFSHCLNVKVNDVTIIGADIGIQLENVEGATIADNNFRNVRLPVQAARVNGLKALGNNHFKSLDHNLNLKPLVILLRLRFAK